MRHRRRGRKLGRNPNHQRALKRNLASALFLTERDADFDENKPKVKGRIVTTLAKAKEVRPLVERCITIARRAMPAQEEADRLETTAERSSDEWKSWREGDGWRQWNAAVAPVLAARRRALKLLGDKEAVQILFDEIAPRFIDRPGGYTRILKLATPRLGDAGPRAILEFVGTHDRVMQRSEKPAFDVEEEETTEVDQEVAQTETSEAATQDAAAGDLDVPRSEVEEEKTSEAAAEAGAEAASAEQAEDAPSDEAAGQEKTEQDKQ